MYKYELRLDNDDNEYLFCDSILTEAQIASIRTVKIREQYSIDDEFKMNRMTKTSTEWKEYNAYIEECLAWENEQLTISANERTAWKDHQRNGENEVEFIAKLKASGMI